jgi:hypothetical protein
MWSGGVVDLHPIKSHVLDFPQIRKQIGIKDILTKSSIQTLNESVLGRFAWLNKSFLIIVLFIPGCSFL